MTCREVEQFWESWSERVKTPYTNPEGSGRIQSSTKHVELCVNERGPPRKAKYSLVTDSEQVPRGKGEKNPGRGVKENLKPCVYKLWKYHEYNRVLFVERSGELHLLARLSS